MEHLLETSCFLLSVVFAVWACGYLLGMLQAAGLPPRNIWLLAGLAAALGVLLFLRGSWWWWVEVLLTLCVLLAIGRLPTTRAFLLQLPRGHQWVMATLVGAVLVGHFARSGYETFPFVSWWMYGMVYREAAVHHVDVVGIGADGEPLPLNPERLYPSLGRGTFRLSNSIRELAENRADPQAQHKLDELLQAIARAYRTRGGLELERIEVYSVSTPMDGSPSRRERVWTAVIPPS